MQEYIGSKIIKAKPEFNSKTMIEGYKMQYEDDYISWSPKEAFEKAYRLTTGMSLGLAIEAMKKGHSVSRSCLGFEGKSIYRSVVRVYEHSSPTYFIKFPNDETHEWVPTQYDIEADDWFIVR